MHTVDCCRLIAEAEGLHMCVGGSVDLLNYLRQNTHVSRLKSVRHASACVFGKIPEILVTSL